jgi:hypothetical protein
MTLQIHSRLTILAEDYILEKLGAELKDESSARYVSFYLTQI